MTHWKVSRPMIYVPFPLYMCLSLSQNTLQLINVSKHIFWFGWDRQHPQINASIGWASTLWCSKWSDWNRLKKYVLDEVSYHTENYAWWEDAEVVDWNCRSSSQIKWRLRHIINVRKAQKKCAIRTFTICFSQVRIVLP